MSTIKADTIVASDGTSPVTLTKQVPTKCWGHFEGSDTTLDGSFNTSGITDNGTGNYTLSISSNMSDAHYSLSIGADWDVVSGNTCHGSSNTMAAGSFVIRIRNGGSNADRDNTTYNVVGDLA